MAFGEPGTPSSSGDQPTLVVDDPAGRTAAGAADHGDEHQPQDGVVGAHRPLRPPATGRSRTPATAPVATARPTVSTSR
jgi:hypothetical protein